MKDERRNWKNVNNLEGKKNYRKQEIFDRERRDGHKEITYQHKRRVNGISNSTTL